MTVSQRWMSGLLLAVCLATLAMYFLTQENMKQTMYNKNLQDFYIVGPEWRQFDLQGKVSRRISADRLDQWPGQPPLLAEPRLRLTGRNTAVWLASARSGRISQAGGPLTLEKEVELLQEPADGGLVLTTEHLRVSDEGEQIETDRAVVIGSGSWHFRAKGLRADLGSQRIELLGEVRGIHD